jgi:hypothetical protein
MALAALFLCVFSLALLPYGLSEALEKKNFRDFLCTCNRIAEAISGDSHVFFPRKRLIPSSVKLQSDA